MRTGSQKKIAHHSGKNRRSGGPDWHIPHLRCGQGDKANSTAWRFNETWVLACLLDSIRFDSTVGCKGGEGGGGGGGKRAVAFSQVPSAACCAAAPVSRTRSAHSQKQQHEGQGWSGTGGGEAQNSGPGAADARAEQGETV